MHPDVDEARVLLSRTPAVLRAWLEDLPDAWLRADEGPGTYSPFDVLGHLLSGEETDWVPRMERLLAHGEERPFEPFDRDAFRERYAALDLGGRLDAFDAARADSLARLGALDLSDLDLAGTHPAFGRVTLGQLLATWVAHDQVHLAQVARVLARRYADAVGPWRAYLPLLVP